MSSRHRATTLTVAAAVLLAGCGTDGDATPIAVPAATEVVTPRPAPTAGTTAAPSSGSALARRGATSGAARPEDSATRRDDTAATASLPTGIVPHRIVIDAIEVDAPVVELGMTATTVEVPEGDDDAGWWTATRRPGELGPAVLGGHVDSRSGPAVFHRLGELGPGDEVVVVAEDGRTRTFTVERVEQLEKGSDPSAIFGFGAPRSELRLVTCAGRFDRGTGHYTDNLVVHAVATT